MMDVEWLYWDGYTMITWWLGARVLVQNGVHVLFMRCFICLVFWTTRHHHDAEAQAHEPLRTTIVSVFPEDATPKWKSLCLLVCQQFESALKWLSSKTRRFFGGPGNILLFDRSFQVTKNLWCWLERKHPLGIVDRMSPGGWWCNWFLSKITGSSNWFTSWVRKIKMEDVMVNDG